MALTSLWRCGPCGRAPATAGVTAHGVFIPPHRGAYSTRTPVENDRFRSVSAAVARFAPEEGRAVAVESAFASPAAPSGAPLQPPGTTAAASGGGGGGDGGGLAADLTADTDVEVIVRAAMQQMGKEYGSKQAELVDKLRDEMYDTAAAFSELREDLLPGLATQWRAPHRLLAHMHRLAAAAAVAGAAAAAAAASQSQPSSVLGPHAAAPAAAERQHPGTREREAGVAVSGSDVVGAGGHGRPEAAAGAAGSPQPRPVGRRMDGGAAAAGAPVATTTASLAATAASGAVAVEDRVEPEQQQRQRRRRQEGGPAAVPDSGVVAARGGAHDDTQAEAGGDAEELGDEQDEQGFSEDGDEEEDEEEEGSDGEDSGAGGRHLGGGELASAALEPDDVDIRHIPIAERRCPGKFRFGHGSGRRVRLTERPRGEPYSLKESETSGPLAAELREFESFSLYGSFAGSQAGEPLRRATCDGYLQCVRQALGWLHRVEGVPLSDVRLGLLVPGTHRGAARRVHAFLMWQERDRGMCKRSVARSLAAIIQVAKFLFNEQSQVREGDKPYSDLEVVKSLRAMYMSYERATRVSGHVVDSGSKWVDWPDYLALVGELRRECAALRSSGRPRSPVDVAMSLQAYLIAAILSCVPDRQRTLRELVVGRTLVKDKGGIWSIRHMHADYKTGGTYGERPPLVLDPGLYYELEEFINVWRGHLKPQHNFLFSKRDGSGPLTAQELSRSFSLHAFRLTGRKLNPHMVRDMVVTYARSGHASEHELEALAIYMGHSLAEQRGTYDRRTKAQKVQPARGLLAKISGAAAAAGAAAGGGGAAATTAAAAAARGGGAYVGSGSGVVAAAQLTAAAATGAAAGSARAAPLAGPHREPRSTRAVPAAASAPAASAGRAAAVAAPLAAPVARVEPAAAFSAPSTVATSDGGDALSGAAPARRTRARRPAQEQPTSEGSGGGTPRKQRRGKAADAVVEAEAGPAQ